MSFTEREEKFIEESLTTLHNNPKTKSLVEEYCALLISNLPAEEKERRGRIILEKIFKIAEKTGKKSKNSPVQAQN